MDEICGALDDTAVLRKFVICIANVDVAGGEAKFNFSTKISRNTFKILFKIKIWGKNEKRGKKNLCGFPAKYNF